MSRMVEELCPEYYGEEPRIIEKHTKIEDDATSSKEPFKPTITPERFWSEYKRVLYCCGWVAYYDRSYDGLERGSPTFTAVARDHSHDKDYYDAKVKKWLKRRDEALHIFNSTLIELGLPFLWRKTTGPDLLYRLTYNPDYRACCYDTVKYGKKNGVILSLAEIEARYDKRLSNREKRKK